MKKKTKRRIASLIAIVILLAGVLSLTNMISDYTSGSLKQNSAIIKIDEGDSTKVIAAKLEDAGIISNPFIFRVFSRLGGYDTKFYVGTFEIYKGEGYKDIFKSLTTQSGPSYMITFPEGYTIADIAKASDKKGHVSESEFKNAAKKDYDFDFLPKNNSDNYLEGYLFPDTYCFDETSTPEQMIITMIKRFDEIYTDEYKKRADELGMSMHEVITLASIIEAEAGSDADRELVSSVFHNRLNSSYPYLESCATVQYVLDKRKQILTVEDTKTDSPYNTYENEGLPPGPICNPGKASIEAALYPADTAYKYFISDADGKIYYSKTFEEHLKNQKEIQR